MLDPFCGGNHADRTPQGGKGPVRCTDWIFWRKPLKKHGKNTAAAGQIIHYINRDFFDFKHEYLFDEIITNMPFKIGRKDGGGDREPVRSIFSLPRRRF